MRYFLALLAVTSLEGQPPNTYVDAQVCATCHAKIAKTYALTGMARSFSRPSPQTPVKFFHQPSQTWYAMIERDGKTYQRRWRIGYQGQESDVQESRVDYVMGSGNHARTYLHRTDRGTLLELPLGWYSENGGTWAMSPGYDRPYTLPPTAIVYECMACHNAYPKIPAGHNEPGSEPVYTGSLPEGIDCQRCHGPGTNHVKAAQAKSTTLETVRSTIVNPSRLNPDRQMEVCMQCHLETTSLALPHSIQKYNRAPFSYKPGEPLANFMLFFDHSPGSRYEDDFEIAHSAYRLRKSQCFLKSASGKLTCTTCHNPHDIPRGEQASTHYNSVCATCHASQLRASIASAKHPADPNCISCHMPKRRTQDVVHTVMTDHLIQRRPPPRDLLAPLQEREEFDANHYLGEVVPYYPATADALYSAVAQVTQRSNLAKGLPRLTAEIAKQNPPSPEFYIELGQAWLSAGKPANAIAPFQEAVKRKPGSPVALLNLADALTQAHQPARALTVLKQALIIAPNDPLLWYQLGVAHTAAGRETEAVTAFEKSVALDPDMADSHNLLGAALATAGDLDRAEKEFRAALQINPDLPEAQGNLGHLFAARADLPQAAYFFAKSIKLRPNDAEVRTNYAVTLARLNQFGEAQQQIDQAVKLDAKSPEAHNFRGTLLEHSGNHDEALKEFLAAIKWRPDFSLAHLNAALIFAAKHDTKSAEQHLREAAKSDNPNIQQKAATALRQLNPM